MTKSKRIDYLDMAKGIGILLVIIGHISYVSEPVRQYISTFHMPLFFVISGMLLYYKQEEKNSLPDLAVRKFKGLMVPYFICSACVLLIESARILWKDANTWENICRQLFQSLCLQEYRCYGFCRHYLWQRLLLWVYGRNAPTCGL